MDDAGTEVTPSTEVTPTTVERELADAFGRGRRFAAGGEAIRASELARIIGTPPEAVGWPRPALYLAGAHIVGALSLSFATIEHPLLFEDCEFDEVPEIYWARLAFVRLDRCRLPGLLAPNVSIDGHLRLAGCEVGGQLILRGARLRGGLLLDGTRLTRPGAVAIDAERAEIGGDIRAEDGFTCAGSIRLFQATVNGGVHLDGAVVDGTGCGPANGAIDLDSTTVRGGVFARNAKITGEVSLRHATVGGVISFSGSNVDNPAAVALRMDRADLRGGVFLLSGCHVRGETRMVSTQVGRTVRLTGALLDNPDGFALLADGLSTDGSFDAREGFASRGTVSLVEARVSGPIHFEGAHLDNPGGTSVRAVGIVAGAVFNCCEGFTATGRVSVSAGRVAGRLCFDDAHLQATGTALKCTTVAAGALSLRYANPPAGLVELQHATVGILRDNPRSWPDRLQLDGLTYQTLEPMLPPESRLDWLSRMPEGLPPQPYEQLAATYRRLGHDEHARVVLLAKQRRQTATGGWFTRAWGWLQDITVGYGYRPQRALAWLAALLLTGAVSFGLHPPATVEPTAGPHFNPVLYTVDLLVPVVSLGQEEHFSPDSGQQWLVYFLIAAGWTLATTAATGITRAANRS